MTAFVFRRNLLCNLSSYIGYLLAICLLFHIVRFPFLLIPASEFDDIDAYPIDCVNTVLVPEIKQENLTSQQLSPNRSAASCINDTSMFKMTYSSQLVRLNLNSSFWTDANCCYHNFWRIAEEPDFKISKSSACYKITKDVTRIPVHMDFLRIICTKKSSPNIIYQDQLAHVRVSKTYSSLEDPVELADKRKDKLSVMIFGIQSTSRMEFLRSYPKTHKFLMQNISAHEFLRYSPTGQGPVQNIYPLLSGLPYKTFFKRCSQKDTYFLDSCPFGWNKTNTFGYHIGFQEESTEQSLFSIGSRYYRNGFRKEQFNYDLRVLNEGLEWLKLGHRKKQSDVSDNQCYGSRLSSKNIIQNFGLFAHAFKARSHFHLTWATTMRYNVKTNDKLLHTMLRELKAEDSLNKTVLIFISDEGMSRGNVITGVSEQEYFEARLPMLYIVLPGWFKAKHRLAARNLKVNTKRLITAVDIYKTFFHLMESTQIDDTQILLKIKGPSKGGGRSLFLPIPRNRTCEEAGIGDLFCVCCERQNLNVSTATVQNATRALLTAFNGILGTIPNCAVLTLKKIISAFKTFPSNTRVDVTFIITFVTKVPRDVVYEGTIKLRGGSFVFEDIRRIYSTEHTKICTTHNETYPSCVCK